MSKHLISLCAIFVVGVSSAALDSSNSYYYPAPIYGAPGGSAAISLVASSLDTNQLQHYFTQDGLGQYSYGYREPLSAKQEIRTLDGVTRGSYSYVDAAGKLQTVQYIADEGGFRVAATNLPNALPKQVEETPEVAAARIQHLAAHEQEKLRHGAIIDGLVATKVSTAHYEGLPRPVEDTPEVAAAKVTFFNRYEEEKLRHKLLREHQELAKSKTSGFAILKAPAPQPIFNTIAPASIAPTTTVYKLLIPAPQRAYLPVV